MTDPHQPPGMPPNSASHPSAQASPSVPPGPSAASVKRRQILLLAGIAGTIVVGTLLSVSLTGSPDSGDRPAKPKSTQILAPGAQVDPRDAWRGQADAQLKTIEQRSRDLTHRNAELEGQGKEMLERLKKLEGSGLTALPPAPVAGPAVRPSFGPDRPNATPEGGLQRFPPPPPPPPLGSGQGMPQAPSGIVSIVLGDGGPAKGAKPATDAAAGAPALRDTRRYLPSGAFTRAVLLGGLDAPTGGQAQRNPQPVLLRLADNAILPNQFRARVKECFVVGAGYGDVSSERADIRTESLSCVTRDGAAIDVPIKGYVAGEDGKAGMRETIQVAKTQLSG